MASTIVLPDTSKRRRIVSFEFALMAPALLLLAILSIGPFVMLIVMSLSNVKLLGGISITSAGLDNWRNVLTDPAFWTSWRTTAIFFVLSVGLELLGGVVFALVLHSLVKARSFMLAVVLLPMFLAPIIVGLLGRFLVDTTIGLYAWFLGLFGIHNDLLSGKLSALFTVVTIDAWEWIPLVALIVLAGLTSVPPSILEASSLDGAGYVRQLFSIVMPHIKPILLVALLIRSMDAVRFYDIITITTNGGPADGTKVIALRLYEEAFKFRNSMGEAAVIGLTMLLFSILLANLFVRFLDRKPEST